MGSQGVRHDLVTNTFTSWRCLQGGELTSGSVCRRLHILGLHIWSTYKLQYGCLLGKYWVSPWTRLSPSTYAWSTNWKPISESPLQFALYYTLPFFNNCQFFKKLDEFTKNLDAFSWKKKKKKHRKTQDICQLELKSTSPHPGRGGVSWVDRVCSLAHSSPTTRTASFM